MPRAGATLSTTGRPSRGHTDESRARWREVDGHFVDTLVGEDDAWWRRGNPDGRHAVFDAHH
ncbi:hypothetical protein AWW66_09210 [Micromonospora rosaria]|uniref:Uncharacterized protein n=1 Tax=Micromonospora rosaria TaxID=47874 RepID=A0A136PV94_9ACTN|nr:hypothetical protein [Micromonospora rosaria]KXK62305.1 hypothetical protein AWW66_09210 [Micromonospora rosaria]